MKMVLPSQVGGDTTSSSSSSSLVSKVLALVSPAIFFYIVIESASVICISKAKDASNRPIYNSATVVLFAEMMKFTISLAGLWHEDPYLVNFKQNFSWKTFVQYGIPAVLYAINNNIFLFVLTLISPSIFQLLLNLRVVWTGVAFRYFLGRVMSPKQWIAMGVLVLGCVIVQYSQASAAAAHGAASPTTSSISSSSSSSVATNDDDAWIAATKAVAVALGLLLTIFYTFVSTAASVFNEMMIKNSLSLHAANLQLYSYGLLFNLLGVFYQGRATNSAYFRGWENPIVWVIFCTMSFSGLLVSRVMQKYDNIVKIYCVSVSNFVVYVFSVAQDGEPLSLAFVVAFFLVSTSAVRYQQEKVRIETETREAISKKEPTEAEVQKLVINNGVVTINNADDFSDIESSDVELVQIKVQS